MKFLFTLVGLTATGALCSPAVSKAELAVIEDCGKLDVMDWKLTELPEGTDISALRKCKKHPFELRITSSMYDPEVEEANLTSPAKRGELVELHARGNICKTGGRGKGVDYDYGCDKGWCWRNCDGPFNIAGLKSKPWCWLAYDGGKKGWTPCGRWQDCEWSYNNKNARCAKGNCGSCGCGC